MKQYVNQFIAVPANIERQTESARTEIDAGFNTVKRRRTEMQSAVLDARVKLTALEGNQEDSPDFRAARVRAERATRAYQSTPSALTLSEENEALEAVQKLRLQRTSEISERRNWLRKAEGDIRALDDVLQRQTETKKELDAAIDEAFRERDGLPRDRRTWIARVLLIWLIPCAVLFVLLRVAIWVGRGFLD
jgi:hypothetical protein